MSNSPAREITLLISQWQRGDRDAEQALFETLYHTLRAIAAQCLAGEKRAQTLTPTGLVHEAYLRLMKSKELQIADRSHFLILVSRVMRRIIVDKVRAVRSEKRGAYPQRVDLLDGMAFTDESMDEILAVDRALGLLAGTRPREASLVELRFFAGFTLDEAAGLLHISERTARRDWEQARIYLKEAIDGTAPTGKSPAL
jgi:RNA polymerase sigma factor (TIGR02999 family)